MPTTTTRRRNELVSALDAVDSAVQSGDTPDEAIAAVALERQLKVGEVGLLVRAFNTGRTHVQLAEGGDAARADAPLADPDRVMPRLRAGVLEKAAELLPPTTHYLHNPLPAVKRACVTMPALPTAPELPSAKSELRALNREAAEYRELVQKAAEFDATLGRAIQAADDAIAELAHRFRQVGGPSIDVVLRAAVGPTGKVAAAVLNQIVARDSVVARAAKTASTRVTLTVAERDALRDAHDLGLAIGRLARQKTARTALHDQLAAAATKLANYIQPPRFNRDPRYLDPTYQPAQKAASGLGTLLPILTGYNAAATYGRATPPLQQEGIRALFNQLDDPAHENRLRGIAARAQLTEMLAADPVLQGYDGADVASGYNALAASAPRAAESPLFMRGMLRRYLGQGGVLDPDDVRSNVLEADKTLAGTADARSKSLAMPTNDMMENRVSREPTAGDAVREIARRTSAGADSLFGV